MTDVIAALRTWRRIQLMVALIGGGLLGAFSCVNGPLGKPLLYGWTLGSIFNLAYLSFLCLVVYARRETEPLALSRKVARLATQRYFYAVIFLVLVAVTQPHWIIGATCGLLSYRLTLVWYIFRSTSSK